MIIQIKDKNTLIFDSFTFRCCVGKNGFNSNKKEGDLSTPTGLFKLKKLYFRKDKVGVPQCKLKKKTITKNIGWCDDPYNKNYNKEINIINRKHKENFYRKDSIYDYLITINYNEKRIPKKGSAIFLHITDNYKPTAGCIALKKKDFLILLKIINSRTKIKIH